MFWSAIGTVQVANVLYQDAWNSIDRAHLDPDPDD